jgi:hypothetical protein
VVTFSDVFPATPYVGALPAYGINFCPLMTPSAKDNRSLNAFERVTKNGTLGEKSFFLKSLNSGHNDAVTPHVHRTI